MMINHELYCLDNRNWTLIVFFILMTLVGLLGSILVLLHDIKSLKEKIRAENSCRKTRRMNYRSVRGTNLEAEMVSALGGYKHLHQEIHDRMDFDLLIKKGFPWDASKFLQESLRITNKDFARILGISEKKLMRLRREDKLVPPNASDRLYRLAQIFSKTKEVLENEGDVTVPPF